MNEFPWKWQNDTYLGSAHGTAGILLVLKRLGNKSYPDKVKEFTAMSKLASGNFKPTTDSNSD